MAILALNAGSSSLKFSIIDPVIDVARETLPGAWIAEYRSRGQSPSPR
jgi:acetate kinase